MPISAEEGSGNLLKVEHIDTFYGHHQALWDVSAEVHQGEIVAIIGSNGAGKSTFLKTVAGLIRPKNGRDPLRGHRHHRLARKPKRPKRHHALSGGTKSLSRTQRMGKSLHGCLHQAPQ